MNELCTEKVLTTFAFLFLLYRSDKLTVQQVTTNQPGSRSPSPNSLLDIEQKRRYTVIGGSTVDERW